MLPGLSGTGVVRLTVLDFGLFRVHENGRLVGIPGYLIETGAGHRILADTGFPPAYATGAAAASRADGLGSFGELVRFGPRHLAPAQLALIGLAPSDIGLIVLTHSHIDHIGGILAFPGVPILMTRTERAHPRPLYFGQARPMAWPDTAYCLIDADATLCRGFDLILTPGHTEGHLSLGLTLPETGPVILTADAVSRPSEPAEGMRGSWNIPAAQASAARLLSLAETRRAMLIYGHCPAQWPTLRKAPQAYS